MWTRKAIPTTPSVSEMGSVSSKGGGSADSRRSTSFTPETTFPQGTAGRARASKRKTKEKMIEHLHKSVVNFNLKIPLSEDNQLMVMNRFGDLISIVKKKDNSVAIVNHSNEDQKVFTREQLPADLDDFKEEWTFFDCKNSAFINKVSAGKTRQIKGSMMVATMWEIKKLISRTELGTTKIGFTLSYKELQYVNTRHQLHITGCVNSLYLPSATDELHEILKEAAMDMSLHPEQFPPAIFGENRIAEFCMIKEYAENGPWHTREKDEKVPSWQKMMLSVEYKEEDEEELIKRIDYAKN